MENGAFGIIGAMDSEVAYLRGRLEGASTQMHMGMEFCAGTLQGHPVVVAMCGIGKVNAALCAGVLVERYGVVGIVNTGVAGSLDARIDIGDLVVSVDAVQHDMDVRSLGYEAGQIPGMDVLAFEADPRLRSAVVKVASLVAPDVRVHEGRVISGDQFVSGEDAKDRIVETFGGLCCEMEGAAIAQACHLAQVPFVVVRAISDKADGTATVDYRTFEKEAADNCARIVEELVRVLFD